MHMPDSAYCYDLDWDRPDLVCCELQQAQEPSARNLQVDETGGGGCCCGAGRDGTGGQEGMGGGWLVGGSR